MSMRSSRIGAAFGLVIAFAIAGCSMQASQPAQATFVTPEAATEAMFKALSANDTTALLALVGPEGRSIVTRSDEVQARRERQVVVAAMIEQWWLEGDGDHRTIVVGNESYPLPMPLVQENGKWRFDTAAGKDEMLYRRVGRNEIAVMDVAEAFVQAEHEYAARSHDGVPNGAYAQRFLSDAGRHNGLYWPASAGDPAPSPMGELAAKAAAEGYGGADAKHDPYQGYYFRVLTAQGPNARGGARSWITNGAMTGGFAMIAWPADYGSSGVMTFLVGADGVLHQKDLGSDTATLAAGITAFNPDSTWGAP
jgi:hypothetical protein